MRLPMLPRILLHLLGSDTAVPVAHLRILLTHGVCLQYMHMNHMMMG